MFDPEPLKQIAAELADQLPQPSQGSFAQIGRTLTAVDGSVIETIVKAARLMPSPARRFVWNELSICYKAVGSRDLSELAEKLAGDDDLQLRIALPFASVTIEFKMSPSSARAS